MRPHPMGDKSNGIRYHVFFSAKKELKMEDTVASTQYDTQNPERQALTLFGKTGVMNVEWDPDAKVTPNGPLVYFAQFLHTGGLFNALCNDAPLHSTSRNISHPRNVLGTLMLAILNGHLRFAHINTLRNDKVAPHLMGMSKIVSEDSVRRAFSAERATYEELDAWLTTHENATLAPLLTEPHIIDLDSSVKPLYGHQEGAEIGYNPKKPGRPSHAIHTAFIASARLVLSVDIQPGKAHAGAHTMPVFWKRYDALPPEARPRLIRGDVSYGNEDILLQCEQRNQPCLFKLARHKNVTSAFRRLRDDADAWADVGEGWQGRETELKLMGWTRARRCVFLRRPASAPAPKPEPPKPGARQPEFEFVRDLKPDHGWEIVCLVTNDATLTPAELAPLYRQRADCENVIDEIKNQWAWSGFMTRDLQRCRVLARLTALVYNWWNIFTRLAQPDRHLEAVTSRPLLLNAVGRLVESGRRKLLWLSSNHALADKIQLVLGRIGQFLTRLHAAAEQLGRQNFWPWILRAAFRNFFKTTPPDCPQPMPLNLLAAT